METHRLATGDRRRVRCLLLCFALFACAFALPGSAAAAIEIETLRFSSTEPDGEPSRLAGAHPDQVTTSFVFPGHEVEGDLLPLELPRNIAIDLPPGMTGNASALPSCSRLEIEAQEHGECPPESQIGFVELFSESDHGDTVLAVPMYNLKPETNTAAMFGLSFERVSARVVAEVHAETNYAVSVVVRNIPAVAAWTRLNVTIWGVPADSSHDRFRGACRSITGEFSGQLCPSTAPHLPLLTNPSACMPALTIRARVDSWEHPDVYDSMTASNRDDAGRAAGITDCESLGFNPTLSVTPDVSAPRTPSGLTVAVHAPQIEDAQGRTEATLQKATVSLPEGVVISPSAVAGLGGCGAGEIGIGDDDLPTCPDDSKVGRLTIDTPMLDEPLAGPIYLARPADNLFGSRFAVYAVAFGRGVLVKLAGRIDPDPVTGQLRLTFDRIPQLPFRDLRVDLWGGERALVSTPRRCGSYTTASELSAWGATGPVTRSATFAVSSGCSGPRFAPQLSAGSLSPLAGAFSSFALRLWREDSDGEFASLSSIDLPPGLAVALKGLAYCPDPVLAAADTNSSAPLDCPGSSRVGSVFVEAGPGPDPLGIAPGSVYLAGPYEGAPLSLAISIPAVIGPFDLGSVILRAALRVDPVDLHAEIDPGRLPLLLAGIPLQLRDLRLEIDRPGFVRNPSNCAKRSVTATAVSTEGTIAHPSSPFGVIGCRRLGFAPKLSLRFANAPTRRGGHPGLRAVLRTRRGDADIAHATLTMPPTELLDTSHIRAVCARRQYALHRCPKTSVYGYAKAWSPLLDQPLQGPVYLRSSHHTLPDLVASLDGSIHVDLAGRIDSPAGKLRSTFGAVPDVPISRFVLTLDGGRRGLLVNNTQLCRAEPRAQVGFIGQNGRVSHSNPLVRVGCR